MVKYAKENNEHCVMWKRGLNDKATVFAFFETVVPFHNVMQWARQEALNCIGMVHSGTFNSIVKKHLMKL